MRKWDNFHEKHEDVFHFSLCNENRVHADG